MTGSTFRTNWKIALKTIFVAGFTAASLDMIAAIVVYAYIQQKTITLKILQSISSAIFGKAAYDGGIVMGLYGPFFHYCIAISFAAAYCFFFHYVSFFRKHTVLSGALYAVLMWMIMNLVALPIAFQRGPSFTWRTAFTGIVILILAVGLPIAFITHYRYKKHRVS